LYYAYAGGTSPLGPAPRVPDEDIAHALSYPIVADSLGDESERWLVIGPNRAGNFLELVVLTTAEGGSWSSTPCPFGPSTRRLLEP
jgi:hypothetical protein